jgi:hypothetical protein
MPTPPTLNRTVAIAIRNPYAGDAAPALKALLVGGTGVRSGLGLLAEAESLLGDLTGARRGLSAVRRLSAVVTGPRRPGGLASAAGIAVRL